MAQNEKNNATENSVHTELYSFLTINKRQMLLFVLVFINQDDMLVILTCQKLRLGSAMKCSTKGTAATGVEQPSQDSSGKPLGSCKFILTSRQVLLSLALGVTTHYSVVMVASEAEQSERYVWLNTEMMRNVKKS